MTELASFDSAGRAAPAKNSASTRQRSWEVFIVPALILIPLTVFWGVQDYPFLILENVASTAGNPRVTAGLSIENAAWAFTTNEGARWQPLTWLSLMLDVTVYRNAAAGSFHFTNLLLHLGAVLFLFAALRGVTSESWPAGMVAGMFAVCPGQVEPVVWLAERHTVLAAFFGTGFLWVWTRWIRSRRPVWLVSAGLLFACSLMSDGRVIALPLLLPVLDAWQFDGSQRVSASRIRITPIGMLMTVSLLFIVVVTFACPAETNDAARLSLFDRSRLSLKAGVTGLVQSFDLRDDATSPAARDDGLSAVNVAGACLMLVSISIAAVVLSGRLPFLLFGWFWYLATLIPPMVLGPVSLRVVTDSNLYIPSIGLFIIVSWSLFTLAGYFSRWRAVVSLIAVPAVLAISTLSFSRVSHWRDNDALFVDPPVSVQFNSQAQFLRARELLSREQPDVPQAVEHLNQAVRIRPDDPLSHALLGKVFFDQKRLDDARHQLLRSIEIRPNLAEAHWYLGLVGLNAGEPDLAIRHFSVVAGHAEFPQVRDYLTLASVYQTPRWEQLRRIEQRGGRYQLASPDPRSDVVMISLAGTSVTDTDLSDWRYFSRLAALDLNGTLVTDDGLPHLSAFTELRTLELTILP
ncbi:MAG: tetratricopeptide repeat protein [Planctomycetaceae bacterium]